mmetsp:Transcript_24889/g.41475  ORF Transcript_24889/g.41475 Transcript_24889/m.41475 type:complete len:228 (-) Transcript_24889:470-1153(-)|eukprot:CAMPEP_0175015028 /NCGR_PEP_ID=MMETSP0005-20121125/10927_1 /TAXON_ID=420556 /ORGANISM="Ochromonas sp., Strain CCMP1393" /LENGTH=227 /DNA_ID=CAMNT_0016271911 /DNA_START=31 /DNA_END=714 /DNA_ORIENTATION=+
MIRMQKKKAAAAAQPAPSEAAVEGDAKSSGESGESAVETSAEDGKEGDTGLSLLGIGGKQIKSGAGKKGKKRTPGEIRIQKDIAELDGGAVAQVDFPNPNDLTNFTVAITPDSGLWCNARYNFSIAIPPLYPHEPPKVTCLTKIYHPNINLEGNVCLNILREEWKPVLDINAVIYGMIYLFYDPNPDDPLNREAADLFRSDKAQFTRVVKRTLQGYSHAGEAFERLI